MNGQNAMTRTFLLDRRSLTGGIVALAGVARGASAFGATLRARTTAITRDGEILTLSNGLIRRVLRLPTTEKPRLATIDYRPVAERSKFFTGAEKERAWEAPEFGFRLNAVDYGPSTVWQLIAVKPASDRNQGEGVTVTLRSEDGFVQVDVRYLLYPDSPVVRKRLSISSLGNEPAKLEDVDVESFALEEYYPSTFSWIYSDYGRRKSLAPFRGGRQDSLVAMHNPDWAQGVVIGNEAAGVMKYIGVCDGGLTFKAGLGRSDSPFPFRRWLKPGKPYSAPQVFSLVYAATPNFDTILNTCIPDFVRKHMGIKLSEFSRKPTFVYNTWEPFQKDINEKLVLELATAAAAAGAETFVIDDGWQDVYGDWNVNKAKFPNGLRPIMEQIKKLGMKPGLWISIGSAAKESQVLKSHPEWFVRNEKGAPYSVHFESDEADRLTACMSTGWRDYMLNLLNRLTIEHGLEYLKLDFAVVTSPYRFDPKKTGCYASDHPGHRDHAESLSTNYDYLWDLFDNFKSKNPHVFIDCTFETMGGIQLVDYAMLQHAEGNWLSNFNEADEVNDLRVRNMAWWRSPAMPATSLVIGNSKLADRGFELHLKSLAGTLPIVLGDPRAMTPAAIALSRRYADFFSRLQAVHGIFSFRQDLAGFGEPAQGQWDGFQRVNTDTLTGGLIGVFRHGATEDRRRVTVSFLHADRTYTVREMNGNPLHRATGAILSKEGFEVVLDNRFDGRLFEVIAS